MIDIYQPNFLIIFKHTNLCHINISVQSAIKVQKNLIVNNWIA